MKEINGTLVYPLLVKNICLPYTYTNNLLFALFIVCIFASFFSLTCLAALEVLKGNMQDI